MTSYMSENAALSFELNLFFDWTCPLTFSNFAEDFLSLSRFQCYVLDRPNY